MIQFKIYFDHMPAVVVEANSGEHARSLGANLAKANSTRVSKVKRVRS